jgi:DNA-directed RNA polymerase specialized sigma24 family protein
VYALCYRIIGNAEDAKDISQLVFLKLWENLESTTRSTRSTPGCTGW